MRIEDFLLARITELERLSEMMSPMNMDLYIQIQKLTNNQRAIIEWNKKWPVLVEEPMEFEHMPAKYSIDDVVMRMTQKYDFVLHEEFEARFGTLPPTAPLMHDMAMMYSSHPDWQEDWRVQPEDSEPHS